MVGISAGVRARVVIALVCVLGCTRVGRELPVSERDADVVVVGAGVGGLAAALEAARSGATVLVVDMYSVFGGHAIMSSGHIAFGGTPIQRALGIDDSPARFLADMLAWGEDSDPVWARRYAESGRKEVYEWLFSIGVRFDPNHLAPGEQANSVRRVHEVDGRGVGLAAPLFRACAAEPRVRFRYNARATKLMVDRGRVVGVEIEGLRTGVHEVLRAGAVVLATGGFQTDPALVRRNWPVGWARPQRLLVGSGVNAKGSGLALATAAGATTRNLDHQWNYVRGVPDPGQPRTDHESEHPRRARQADAGSRRDVSGEHPALQRPCRGRRRSRLRALRRQYGEAPRARR